MAKETKKKEEQVKMSFKEKAQALDTKFSTVDHDRFFIPTGSIYFDWGLGGGYQSGRIYEFISWEGAGKTSCALHAVAECQAMGKKVVYIDAEHALDEEYAKAIGVDWSNEDNLTIFQPDNGEDGFEYAKAMIETGEVSLVVLDSINGLLPKKQLEDPAGTVNLGLHARLIGGEIPKLKVLASKHNVVVICVSQIREKIGVMFGSPETTQGGNALKFWASGRIDIRKENVKEGEEVVGIYSKFKILKNKVCPPYRKGKIPIVFGVGIDKMQEIIDLGKESEVIRPWGSKIIIGNEKWEKPDFINLVNDNPEFKAELVTKIKNYLNGNPTVEAPTPEELKDNELSKD